MLTVSGKQRASMKEILSSPWIVGTSNPVISQHFSVLEDPSKPFVPAVSITWVENALRMPKHERGEAVMQEIIRRSAYRQRMLEMEWMETKRRQEEIIQRQQHSPSSQQGGAQGLGMGGRRLFRSRTGTSNMLLRLFGARGAAVGRESSSGNVAANDKSMYTPNPTMSHGWKTNGKNGIGSSFGTLMGGSSSSSNNNKSQGAMSSSSNTASTPPVNHLGLPEERIMPTTMNMNMNHYRAVTAPGGGTTNSFESGPRNGNSFHHMLHPQDHNANSSNCSSEMHTHQQSSSMFYRASMAGSSNLRSTNPDITSLFSSRGGQMAGGMWRPLLHAKQKLVSIFSKKGNTNSVFTVGGGNQNSSNASSSSSRATRGVGGDGSGSNNTTASGHSLVEEEEEDDDQSFVALGETCTPMVDNSWLSRFKRKIRIY
jgi:hypothetical protein